MYQPVIERKQVFHTLVYVSYVSYQHDTIDQATYGMEEQLHSRWFLLDNLDMAIVNAISVIITTVTRNIFVFHESVFCVA